MERHEVIRSRTRASAEARRRILAYLRARRLAAKGHDIHAAPAPTNSLRERVARMREAKERAGDRGLTAEELREILP